MPTAKSYMALPVLRGPYMKSGRQYCIVKTNNGKEKEVRWYSDREWAKMYGAEAPSDATTRPQKAVLGFEKGFITLVRGKESALEASIARYCVHWGWYIISTDEVPPGFTTAILPWEKVGNPNGSLKDPAIIKMEVAKLAYT